MAYLWRKSVLHADATERALREYQESERKNRELARIVASLRPEQQKAWAAFVQFLKENPYLATRALEEAILVYNERHPDMPLPVEQFSAVRRSGSIADQLPFVGEHVLPGFPHPKGGYLEGDW
jgi:hypothetical protein